MKQKYVYSTSKCRKKNKSDNDKNSLAIHLLSFYQMLNVQDEFNLLQLPLDDPPVFFSLILNNLWHFLKILTYL